MNIIALCGPIGAGKSAIAAELARNHGYVRASFAYPIKLMLEFLLEYRGASEDEIEQMLWGDKKNIPTGFLSGRTPRFAMQTLGTEWGRNLMSTGFWPDAWESHVRRGEFERIVVDDLRFPSEAVQIRESGGTVVGILRSGISFSTEHESERMAQTVYSGADILISNNSTIQIAATDLMLVLKNRGKDAAKS